MPRIRRVAAHRLRRKAERYLALARTNGDAEDIEMLETKAAKHHDEASRIERESGEEETPDGG